MNKRMIVYGEDSIIDTLVYKDSFEPKIHTLARASSTYHEIVRAIEYSIEVNNEWITVVTIYF